MTSQLIEGVAGGSVALLALTLAAAVLAWLMTMGVTVRREITLSGDTVSTTENATFEGGSSTKATSPCPKAYAGTLTTRASGTAGTVTIPLASAHNITAGQRVDLYWTDDEGDQQWAYGATVSGVTTTTVAFTGMAGTALPDAASEVIIAKAVVDAVAFDGDNIVLVTAYNNGQTGIVVFASNAANLYAVLVQADAPMHWTNLDDGANPLAGMDVTKVWMSSSKTASADTGQRAYVMLDLAGTGSA